MLQVSSQHKHARHLFYFFAGIIVLSTFGVSSYPCAFSIQDPRTTALCDSGFAVLEREEFEKARLLFDEVLELDEESVKGLLGMGRAWLGLPARTRRALDYLNKAISLDADCVDAHYYCAIAHLRLSETDITSSNARKALKELDEVIRLNPSHADAYYQRGNVFLDSFTELESAGRAFRNQIDINPDHSGARFELLRLEMGTGDWNSAIAVAESTLVVNPGMEPELQWYNLQGELIERIRVLDLDLSTSDDDYERLKTVWKERLESIPEEARADYRRTGDRMAELMPAQKPPWSYVAVDDAGYYWLRVQDKVDFGGEFRFSFHILSPDGEYLGVTKTPPYKWRTMNIQQLIFPISVSQATFIGRTQDEETGEIVFQVYRISSNVRELKYPPLILPQ